MDWEEQKKCFMHYAGPKVIVATNVAQTSITIPDIDMVIDTGTARISIAENGIQGLFLKDISQADIMQRKGRAGRTKNGKYILCSDTSIEERPEFTVPEMQRSILDRVVLQLASIGIDANMLEFYHQPNRNAIATARKVLNNLGAMDQNGNVTEIGNKMVKMPVSVQLARMIVEAEKYEVTEPVMTIAAITEIGGLLSREGSYHLFTGERDSDLLAELDVWNEITKMQYIDFIKLGIHKKNFFRIKEHLKKLKEALYGIVKMSNKGDRDAILKSCLFGMASHIYARDEYGESFWGEDNISRRIDKKSCVRSYYTKPVKFVVGVPKTIEYQGSFGFMNRLDLISFVSKVSPEMIFELAPDRIKEKVELQYSGIEDAVQVFSTKTFLGKELRTESHFDYEHPQYAKLKAEYEEQCRKEEEYDYWRNSWNREERVDNRQKTVMIGGKSFSVSYSRDNKPKVYIDTETLFTTDEKEILLENGMTVYVSSGMSMREERNLVALRNALENKRISNLNDRLKRQYERLKATTLREAVRQKDMLGKVKLTMDRGGYGINPIFVYGCLSLKKNTVSFDVTSDEELANSNTIEALQYLFMKEVAKKYGDNKFSHQTGKKKKVLTDSEKRVKEDFDSLVRECLRSLTIDNALENMEFLEEYYQELMGK